MNKIATTSLLLFLAHGARADINMMEASFKTEFIDLQIDGLNLSRTYDSRSTYSGLFGFGWCSTLDTELVRDGRRVELRECGAIKPVTGNIKLDRDTYLIERANGLIQRFSLEDGRLTGLKNPGHTEVQILRARGAMPPPRSLSRRDATEEGNKRNQVRMELDDSGRVARIEADQRAASARETAVASSADYLYGPEGNLLKAKNAWSNTYSYKYDRLHNLTDVFYPDGTKETLTYDTDRDRVTSFQGRHSKNGCKETYRYTIEPTQKQLTQTSIATLTCPDQTRTPEPRVTRFEFKFKKRQDNRWALARLNLSRDGKTQTTTYKLGGLQ